MASNSESDRPASRTVRLTCSICDKPFRVLESQRSDVVSCPHCTTEIDAIAQLRAASPVVPVFSDRTVNPSASCEETERKTGDAADPPSQGSTPARGSASSSEAERQRDGGEWSSPKAAARAAVIRWAYLGGIAACLVLWLVVGWRKNVAAEWHRIHAFQSYVKDEMDLPYLDKDDFAVKQFSKDYPEYFMTAQEFLDSRYEHPESWDQYQEFVKTRPDKWAGYVEPNDSAARWFMYLIPVLAIVGWLHSIQHTLKHWRRASH